VNYLEPKCSVVKAFNREKRKTKLKNIFGCFLILVGLLVVAFSNKIVFPGLERLVGIEAIVGKENVVYEPDGGYYFTNPTAMVEWVGSMAIFGLLICFVGIWLSGIRVKFPTKKV
jgi:hypothetical protein